MLQNLFDSEGNKTKILPGDKLFYHVSDDSYGFVRGNTELLFGDMSNNPSDEKKSGSLMPMVDIIDMITIISGYSETRMEALESESPEDVMIWQFSDMI